MGKGLNKALKERKKLLWPSFLFKCSSFYLENFNHAIKVLASMEALRLHNLPKRQFDPDKVTYNITSAINLKPYNHEDNDFEDLLQLAESFEQVFKWAKANLSPKDFENFGEFRNKWLEVIPMHLLKMNDKPTPSVTINSEEPIYHKES